MKSLQLTFILQHADSKIINDDLSVKIRKYHQFFKQDVRTGKGLISLTKKELERGNVKTAFREYFVHYCPEYMHERGKVDHTCELMYDPENVSCLVY